VTGGGGAFDILFLLLFSSLLLHGYRLLKKLFDDEKNIIEYCRKVSSTFFNSASPK